jgi:hypothetical protein
MSSKRRLEGEVLIDHRDSPGSNPQLAHALGLPHVPGGARYESAVVTCSHCQRQIVLNPDRSRERGYCRKCDRYICDRCTTIMAQTLECVPFKKVLDEAQEAAFRAEQSGSPIISKR